MRLLFIGTDWITKWILTQTLFDDSEEEHEITVIGQDTPEWFWTEVPRLKEYMGDERIDYKQTDIVPGIDFDAVYITDMEEGVLHAFLLSQELQKFAGPIILASSWQVYGWKKKKKTPILETERELNPETNQAKHLRKLEEVMTHFKQLQTVILRYGEVFGPYMPDGSEVINMMIDALSSEEIDVYPPPSRQYDWIHVKYIYNLVPKLFTRKFIGRGEIYNIGSGEERKITWLANALRQLTNSPASVKIHMPQEVEPKGYHSRLDVEKAKKFLQFEPEGIYIKEFLEVCRWVESALPEDQRDKLDWSQAPKLEDTYPMLRPDFDIEQTTPKA